MSEAHYPDYPPHWIHVHPPVNDGQGGVINQYQDERDAFGLLSVVRG